MAWKILVTGYRVLLEEMRINNSMVTSKGRDEGERTT
jgi:hypothetical protein